jgi:TRAP-type mannitol/chloroaromatic compound transport system substrate-binding protein
VAHEQPSGISRRAFFFGLLFSALLAGLGTTSLLPAPASGPRGEGGQASQERLRWRLPVAFGTQLPALGDNILYVRDALAGASDGALALDVFEPGEIVSAFAITEAVREGKVPAGYTWLGYDQGRTPAAPLFGAVPFGLSPWAFMAWWFEGDGQRLAEEIYHAQGLHPILCGLIGPETAGWFRKPIDRPEDLAGLKIRFAGLGGKTLQALGASVTMIPGSDLFQALEKGAIDATEYSLPVVDEMLGFHRVAPINYFPGWHQPFTAFHLVINLDRWRTLTPPTQAALTTACTAGVARNLARSEGLQGAILARFEAEGVDTRQLAPALLATLEAAAESVLEAEAEANATFAQVYENQKAFATRYATWDRLAYPRSPAP